MKRQTNSNIFLKIEKLPAPPAVQVVAPPQTAKLRAWQAVREAWLANGGRMSPLVIELEMLAKETD